MTTDRVYNVLFLCTANSSRSILAESILETEGKGRFKAYSAGSQPRGEVNPLALKERQALGYPATGFRSKS
ncbi:arsenate reductase ArsC, partial [Rhizobium phaseoli]